MLLVVVLKLSEFILWTQSTTWSARSVSSGVGTEVYITASSLGKIGVLLTIKPYKYTLQNFYMESF
jgi:hypothetical protein